MVLMVGLIEDFNSMYSIKLNNKQESYYSNQRDFKHVKINSNCNVLHGPNGRAHKEFQFNVTVLLRL